MLIPKIIHHTWIGDDPLPEEGWSNIESWKERHPGWRFQLWTRNNLPPLRNRRLYDLSPNTGHRADILRYEVLLRYGGVYADVDVVCRQNIEPVLGHIAAFISSHNEDASQPDRWWPEIAFMGCVPRHPFLERIVGGLEKHYYEHEHEIVSLRTGPGYFGTQLQKWKRDSWRTTDDDVIIFPPRYFSPYSFTNKEEGRKGFYPEAYTEHLFWGSW